VRIGAELWRAELAPGSPAVESGALVRVREVRGLTLVVEAC
jgi:membrane protein implicated in regulation of membrane protease activity